MLKAISQGKVVAKANSVLLLLFSIKKTSIICKDIHKLNSITILYKYLY